MDRLISERAVIESIEYFQMNPQRFDFVDLIDDIKEIPSTEPCEEAINRSDALDVIARIGLSKSGTKEVQAVLECLRAVEALLLATPQPKTGYWIYDDECHEHGHCSECGYGSVDLVDGEPHHFCPKCGTKMIEK